MAQDTPLVDESQATTQISYCPHLGIYHYRRADGAEYFFDNDHLEQSIEGYRKQGALRDAEFMAHLTAWARNFPHKLATFYADGQFKVQQLAPRKEPEDELDMESGLVAEGESQAIDAIPVDKASGEPDK